MTEDFNADQIAQELGQISPLVDYVIALSEKVEGTQVFLFEVKRKLFTDEMVSICRDMAAVIRREIPERPNRWAASIYAEQYGDSTMGIYSIGWAGHPDEWQPIEGQEWTPAYYAEFLALSDRLRGALVTLGTEGDRIRRDGDFRVADGENGQFRQLVFVYRPEFLTKDLIRIIQNVLRGSDKWFVHLFISFGPSFEPLWEGIDVHVDSTVELWDRQEAEQLLGDRLKI